MKQQIKIFQDDMEFLLDDSEFNNENIECWQSSRILLSPNGYYLGQPIFITDDDELIFDDDT